MRILNSRAWIILEPVVLLVALGLASRAIAPYVGVAPGAVDTALAASPPDWGALADLEFRMTAVKWGMLITAAFVLSRLRGYRIANPLRASAPRLSSGRLALFGFAVAVPLSLASLLPRWRHFHVAPLGETPPIWDLIYSGGAWTPEFWAFMVVSSFLLVPIVEELFFRGYHLGALARVFSPPAAILVCAFVFAAMHLQYLSADAFALYNAFMVFIAAATLAWTVFATRSLIPAIVAHAYGNFPRPLEWAPYETAMLAPAAIILIWLTPKLFARNERGA